ncbi:unnamed protein product [Tilletia controversa]|uniref:Protein arginine methyltransferase NDUFAF7 n=1 Tax=Tilletia caries TaxID=13290 RepID=A0ABN7IZY6_9BASI|nr:unnamed protein product [Tilletia caries]CAD6903270.1 unnamed protein product [Tilletia controversa]CAD6950189.1 unnamed protein product [Tilletia laevis]CAD6934294.1 unnamed protein product [Tilletia caries]CAD6934701.1 unnamed protein product [Tilletia controversa]
MFAVSRFSPATAAVCLPRSALLSCGSSSGTTGPMPVSTWMTRCLLDPVYGYYSASSSSSSTSTSASNQSPIFGAKGDFITSPDISQVFGELLAIWFLTRFQPVAAAASAAAADGTTSSRPLRARLVELGPGRGALLSDMLRTFSNFPSLLRALSAIDLVETSPALRKIQRSALESICAKLGKKPVFVEDDDDQMEGKGAEDADAGDERQIRVRWYDRPESIPVRPDVWTAVVAHEFFDALPINIFERTGNGWREIFVDVKRNSTSALGIREERAHNSAITVLRPPSSSPLQISTPSAPRTPPSSDPEFTLVLSPGPTPLGQLLASSNPRFNAYAPGQRVEVSAEAWAAARAVGRLVSGTSGEEGKGKEVGGAEGETKPLGGAGLIVDYGGEQAFSDSFRAFRHHQLADPLQNPGKQDLTANVDFTHIRSAIEAGGATTHPLATQQSFLLRLGLQPRLDVLLRSAPDEARRKSIESGAERLVEGGKVGMGETFKVLGITAGDLGDGEGEQESVYPFGK